jgi:hypothetical protein
MNRLVLVIVACLLQSGPLAAYPSFDTPTNLTPVAMEVFEVAPPVAIPSEPVRWLGDRGSAGYPDDYSDDAYSREEERLRDGE